MTKTETKIWAIIPAGGVGARMAAVKAKQYLPLFGKTIIEHSLLRLASVDSIHALVVGIAKEDAHWSNLGFRHPKFQARVEAGEQRVDTVELCLRYIAEQGGSEDWALVHDAARPCVRPDEVQKLIDAVRENNQGGILALPISDTIKRSIKTSGVEVVTETIPRNQLWRAMTPQMFKVGELLNAISVARDQGVEISDEASAMEALGREATAKGAPQLVLCSADNIKITLPQDLVFAESIMQAQETPSAL